MKREEFYRAMNDKRRPAVMHDSTVNMIIGKALTNPKNNCICMEELAELQKEISKFERGFGDRLALIEEIADVAICLELLAEKYHITDGELSKSQAIKLERIWIKNGGSFEDLSKQEGSVKDWIL